MFGIIMGGHGDRMEKTQRRAIMLSILIASGKTMEEAWKIMLEIEAKAGV